LSPRRRSSLICNLTLAMLTLREMGELGMGSRMGIGIVALVVVLVVAGCASRDSTACQCPKPIAYDDATLKKITQALRALPADNVLHQAMDDYENERDDLRFCPAGTH
jgi:hypothetical protein